MNRADADNAIEHLIDGVTNKRNLANPDILRAVLAGAGLVIVPREATSDMESAFVLQGTKRMNFRLQYEAAIDAALSEKAA